jgi:spore germination cell wall hydrolase CwlJ-like protein
MKTAIADAPVPESPPADILGRAMLLVISLGLLVCAWVVARTDPVMPPPAVARLERPPTPPPPVEPLELKAVAPQDAVAINTAVPFSTAPNPAARPFVLASTSQDYARSLDCLAAVGLYEAGSGDADGQRAVIQVVLNRLRHPAFPKTICGVVFQGSERKTGCQFTFTCDGAMRRVPSADAWGRARAVAQEMLGGRIYASIGHSTHYHTDWVVPYWSASLDKVAAVGTHLFFRWAGWWGTPGAFHDRYGGGEPAMSQLAGLSEAHRGGAVQMVDGIIAPVEAIANPVLLARYDKTIVREGDSFIVPFGRKVSPDSFPSLALAACGTLDHCKVMGWAEIAETPRSFPVDPTALAGMSFSYLRNRKAGFEKALWNCEEFNRPDKRDCMKQRTVTAQETRAPRTGKERISLQDMRTVLLKPAAEPDDAPVIIPPRPKLKAIPMANDQP